MEKVKFKQMKDGTKEEYLLLERYEKKFIEGTADRLINFMSNLSNTFEIRHVFLLSNEFFHSHKV